MPRYYELTAHHMNMRRRWGFGQTKCRHLNAVMKIISLDAISWLMQFSKIFRHTFLYTHASHDDLYNLFILPILHVHELSLAILQMKGGLFKSPLAVSNFHGCFI